MGLYQGAAQLYAAQDYDVGDYSYFIEQEARAVAATIPLRRMGDVEEFGRSVAWLASPASSYIH